MKIKVDISELLMGIGISIVCVAALVWGIQTLFNNPPVWDMFWNAIQQYPLLMIALVGICLIFAGSFVYAIKSSRNDSKDKN